MSNAHEPTRTTETNASWTDAYFDGLRTAKDGKHGFVPLRFTPAARLEWARGYIEGRSAINGTR